MPVTETERFLRGVIDQQAAIIALQERRLAWYQNMVSHHAAQLDEHKARITALEKRAAAVETWPQRVTFSEN